MLSATCLNLDQSKILSSGNGLRQTVGYNQGYIYRENVYSTVVYQKYLTRLRELIMF